MKILIYGSNSCAGIHFVDYCLKRGYEVYPTSRTTEAIPPFRFYNEESVRFIEFNINSPLDHHINLLNKIRPDYLVNFASQSMVAESWDSPKDWVETNVNGIINVLDSLKLYGQLKKYVHFSTPEVYGNTEGWVLESSPYDPSTPYAATRALGDMFVKMYSKQYGLPVVITRAANVYGEGQKLYRIIPKTLYCIASGKKLPLHGGGVTERSFIHCHDVSTAIDLILSKGEVSETYHISPRDSISIKNLVKKITALEKFDFDSLVLDSSDRPGKDLKYLLDSSKLRQLGWEDEISIDEGLNRVSHWFHKEKTLFNEDMTKYLHSK
jgi:dTDP-glucose 4,6-dehydratase